tara:strand:- start:1151 stop:3034 length:1884 start_codon:yes stop_codon:yes gene_type:complete
MCGIAGIFDSAVNPDLKNLNPMLDIMVHRGPDGEGTFVKESIAMGMRRLAIIDLVSGDQPISNNDHSVTVIFNGEIYNYIELKNELEQKGYLFKTNSDTEVLVHLYSEYSYDMLKYLNGMFAFSIWDRNKKSLFIARDRMGIKPLYYATIGQRFIFSSELKSILTQTQLDISLNMNGLADYLRLGYIPREQTPYKYVKKLLPGHYLVINKSEILFKKWWDLKDEYVKQNEASSQNKLNDISGKSIFNDSVKLRMRSDVPVASFLSGGLDSSLISVTASKMSKIQLQTYNIKFDDALFDESSYAKLVAENAKTNHKQLVVNVSDIIKKLPLLIWHMDEPIADSAIIPNFLISDFAAKNVKVCLSGLGGDELFGGYSRYIDRPFGPYRRFLLKYPWLLKLIFPILKNVSPFYAHRLAPFVDKKNTWKLYLNLIQQFDVRSLKKLGFNEFGSTEKIIKTLWFNYPGTDSVGRRQYIDQQTYLPDQILALTDRMSMAVSLEVRVPFLDHNLINFSSQLSENMKQTKNGEFKIWLKNTFADKVPKDIVNRKKWGFGSPVENWMHSKDIQSLIKKVPEILSEILNENYVRKLINDVDSPRYHNQIWTLLTLAVWLKVRTFRKPPRLTINQLFE